MSHITRFAKKAAEDTTSLMIMEYKNFESQLFKQFAKLIIEECCTIVESGKSKEETLEEMRKIYG